MEPKIRPVDRKAWTPGLCVGYFGIYVPTTATDTMMELESRTLILNVWAGAVLTPNKYGKGGVK